MTELTPRQRAAWIRWLDEQADRYEAEIAEEVDASRRERWANYEYGMLTAIATVWARVIGDVPTICAEYQAQMAWHTFTDHDGLFSPLDVHEYYTPDKTDYEVWSLRYVSTLIDIDGGEATRLTEQEAHAHVEKIRERIQPDD